MAGLQEASRLGISPFEESAPVELLPARPPEQVEAVIAAAYRQVFGNEHILASDRLGGAESMLRSGAISVRDFVRMLAESPLYREKFLYPNFHVRFIELNFKHLLGRSPYEQSEISEHLDLFLSQGYEAEINSYLSSEEYLESFGENIVPYYRDFQLDHPGQRAIGFSRLLHLQRGYAASDRAQKQGQPRLTTELARNTATSITAASGGVLSGGLGGARGDVYRLRVMQSQASNAPVVRQSMTELLVSYDQLTTKLQCLSRAGRKVVSVTAV
ncbi:phycobilisome rod-core linker polypeptide [Lyngbya confervoides]|uniref:Phycobilisome linker polypeptide n=1 Tax=Lyngbya confervoides BDU141951 TaxID=1574623 RepID=A0ABD4T2N5_9CYAN|nr:phycobilisome rod-core linker polypeptide [Lyngbya confervoides]MCM1983031.1 phycobilisome linker polypeptide [Lyngbya confervoides BDU141951]